MDRRELLTTVGPAALVVGTGVAGCATGTDITGFIMKLLDVLGQVQQGVRTAMTAACSVATGSLVPAFDVALAAIETVLGAILGQTNIYTITAIQIQAAVDMIVKLGCPPAPAGAAASAPPVIVTPDGKKVPVVFIK